MIALSVVVEARLIEARLLCSLLPDRQRRFLDQVRSGWPQTTPDQYGRPARDNLEARSMATPEAIDRMDEALAWLTRISNQHPRVRVRRVKGGGRRRGGALTPRELVVLRVGGQPWCRSEKTLRDLYVWHLAKLAVELGGAVKR